jgi:uncharacterized protein with LGFP repeats
MSGDLGWAVSEDQLTSTGEGSADLNVTMQGGQIGSGNTMNNVWRQEGAIDPTRVEHLTAYAGADYVGDLPLKDAVFVLATAKVAAAAGVLRVLLTTRKDLAMTILTRVNREKAEQLVEAIGPAGHRLKELPLAAEAVEVCRLGASGLGGEKGPLSLAAASQQGTNGYFQSFEGGIIHWCEAGGAQVTSGAVAAYHGEHGGTGSRLGFPVTEEMSAQTSPFGTDGSLQRFEGHWPYADSTCERLGTRCGAAVYRTDEYGAHAAWGGIGEFYELNGRSSGPLGFPVEDEAKTESSSRDAGPGTAGWRQRFEGGVAYYSEKTKTIFVPNVIAEHHELHGGVTGDLGFPVSPELTASPSPHGTTGRYQRFEARIDYGPDILAGWDDGEMPGGATIYVSDAHGVHSVGWGNGELYERSGGTSGWLGFPLTGEVDRRAAESDPWCTIQEFEGGAIFYKEAHGSVPVPRLTLDFIASREGLGQQLGFPTQPELILDPERGDRLQFFERGLVTVQGGIKNAWLKLVPEHPAEVYDRQIEAAILRLLPAATIKCEPVRSDDRPDFLVRQDDTSVCVETKWRLNTARPFGGSTLPQLVDNLPVGGRLLIIVNANEIDHQASRYVDSLHVRSRIVRWRDVRDDATLGQALIELLARATD